RKSLIEHEIRQGTSRRDAVARVDADHAREVLQLRAQIALVESERIRRLRLEQETVTRDVEWPWQPWPPITALATSDVKSIEFWNHEVERRSDDEFVQWLAQS